MLLVIPASGLAEVTLNAYKLYVAPKISRVILYHAVLIFTWGNADTEISMKEAPSYALFSVDDEGAVIFGKPILGYSILPHT